MVVRLRCFKKAFDTAWYKGLLFKLKQRGIDCELLEWISDYLGGIKQKVLEELSHQAL